MFVDLVRSTYGAQLSAAKGIVGLAATRSGRSSIHGVQHYFHPAHCLGWPDADRRSRLVFITRDLDRAVLEKLWAASSARPRSTPDAAALCRAALEAVGRRSSAEPSRKRFHSVRRVHKQAA